MPENFSPSDFVDTDDVFDEDYNPDEITYAGFTIVPGDSVDHATLVYRENGIEGSPHKWGISMYYGYRYNGPDIPIPAEYARRVLENLADGPIEDYDWASSDMAYFE